MTPTRLTTILPILFPIAMMSGCAGQVGDGEEAGSDEAALSHAADLASHMPAHLAIVDTMAWFGVPASVGGPDPSWGNWDISAFACIPDITPLTCDAAGDREVASRYHPLVGAYSSTGRDAEGLAHIKLMLSNLRSACDDSARLDAYSIQLDGTHFSSLHGGSAPSVEGPLHALQTFLTEADAEKRTNAVVPMDDATWYWNNGHWLGLDCSKSRATCISYLQQDVIDMLQQAAPHASALRIAGKLVLRFYLDTAAGFPTVAEWQTIFANARAATGLDFYTLGSHAGSAYFAAFDALSPWVDPSYWWPHTAGSSVYAHAQAYAAAIHKDLFANVPAGHVVFGGAAPGFDDFTKRWGDCVERQMPVPSEGKPRHLDVLRGTIDYLKTKNVKGIVLSTWDDWTEGTFLEPSLEEGTEKIVTLRQKLGDLFGDAQNAGGDAALTARWTGFGKTFPCSGGPGTTHVPALCASCAGPMVLEPTANESVGPAIHLRVSGGACLGSMIAYIDGVEGARALTNSIDQWVSVSMGTHRLHVNAWEPDGTLHQGTVDVTFTRTY